MNTSAISSLEYVIILPLHTKYEARAHSRLTCYVLTATFTLSPLLCLQGYRRTCFVMPMLVGQPVVCICCFLKVVKALCEVWNGPWKTLQICNGQYTFLKMNPQSDNVEFQTLLSVFCEADSQTKWPQNVNVKQIVLVFLNKGSISQLV